MEANSSFRLNSNFEKKNTETRIICAMSVLYCAECCFLQNNHVDSALCGTARSHMIKNSMLCGGIGEILWMGNRFMLPVF
jgi:hypothetical protein